MGRRTTGRLFTRTTAKYGKVWYLDYTHNGHRQKVRLSDRDGKPIINRRDAEEARNLILEPYKYRDEATRQEKAVQALLSAESVAVKAEAEADRLRNRRRLADAWALAPYDTTEGGRTERPLAASSVRDHELHWRRFVDWAALRGLTYMQDITADHADDYRRSMFAAGYGPQSGNRALGALRVMFKRSKVVPNPFDALKRFAIEPRGRRELTIAELRTVCSSADGELRTLFALGLFTGQRLKDCCLLDWATVSDGLTLINFKPAKTRRFDKHIAVPVHAELAAILAETPPEKRNGYVLPKTAAAYQRCNTTVVSRLQAHFQRCGIETKSEPDLQTGRRVAIVGFHSLRHSFVSACARRGIPLSTVQELCGHSSRDIQQKYLHVGRDDLTAAIGALPTLTGDNHLMATDAADRRKLAEIAATGDMALVQELLRIAASEKTKTLPN